MPQYYGEPLDYAQLPQDDAVYESIQQADTVGLFQIESRAQMSALPRTKPKCFADLSMQVAIIRPGPVTGKFVNPYIARRLGRAADHLSASIVRAVSGTNAWRASVSGTGDEDWDGRGEPHRWRSGRAAQGDGRQTIGGHHRRNEDAAARRHDGKRNQRRRCRTEMMRVLATVKEFMFPESHAHSFASIAYSSAYTSYHYLAAYTCALLNNQPMGFYSPATILNDAKRHGLKVLPIDVQQSEWFCTLEELSETDRSQICRPLCRQNGLQICEGIAAER